VNGSEGDGLLIWEVR